MTPPTKAMLELAAKAICKSRSCEGWACCQWPAQIARKDCPVKNGGYDEAAHDVIAALRSSQNNGDSGERKRVIDECARCVPTNWADVLLTGPEAPKGSFDARAIEQLLRGIQDRIRALKSGEKGS